MIAFAAICDSAKADTYNWNLGSDGLWDAANAWRNSSGPTSILPGSSDDVINNTLYAINHASGVDTINSFLNNQTGLFTMSGGRLTVNQSFTSNGAVNLTGGVLSGLSPLDSTFQVNAVCLLDGGTLANFAVNAGSGGQGLSFASNNNTVLDNLVVNANLDMSNGGRFQFRNGLTLNGTASVNNGGYLFSMTDQTLNGTGTIVFGSSGGGLSSENNNTLTIGSGITLQGGGNSAIGEHGFTGGVSNLINTGTISADVSGQALRIDPNGQFINNSLIQGTSGGTLRIQAGSWTNNGTLAAKNGGTVFVNSNSWTNTGAISASDANSTVFLNGTIVNERLIGPGGVSPATMNVYGGKIVLQGTLNIPAAFPLVLPGNQYAAPPSLLDSSTGGTFLLDGGRINGGSVAAPQYLRFSQSNNNYLDTVSFAGNNTGVDLTDGGRVHILGGQQLITAITLDNGAILAYDHTQTVDGTGPEGPGVLIFRQHGTNTVSIEGNSILTLGPGMRVFAEPGQNNRLGGHAYVGGINTLINYGLISDEEAHGGHFTIEADRFYNYGRLEDLGNALHITSSTFVNSGTVLFGSGNIISSYHQMLGTTEIAGSVQALGTGIQLDGGALTGTGTIQGNVGNDGGTVSVTNASGPLTIDGNYLQSNTGNVSIGANSSLAVTGTYTQTGGSTNVNGTLDGSGAAFHVSGGDLSGSGTVNFHVVNDGGVVSPGNSPGRLTINGDYDQTINGSLSIQLGGYVAGQSYDQLVVNGNAHVAGDLDVSLYQGFVPKVGDIFDIFNYSGALTGTFNLISEDAGYSYLLLYNRPGEIDVEVDQAPTTEAVPEGMGLSMLLVGLMGIGIAMLWERRRVRLRSCLQ